MPYAVLAVAATSMVGVWMAANNNKNAANNTPVEEEEDLTPCRTLSAVAVATATSRNERQNKIVTSGENLASGANRRPATASMYEAIHSNLSRSSLNIMDSMATPCSSCERQAKQVPGGNASSYYATDNAAETESSTNSRRPKSVITQDKNKALVRKHRTLRLLDKFKTQTSVDSKYSWNKDKMVGEGAYSKVYMATAKDTNDVVALKNISKEYTDSQYFQQEVEAMLYIQEKGGHPHVITLHEHFEDGDCFILILDFIRGGELFDHLIETGAYSEMDASRIVREVASALLFLHGIGLVHADLKPEVCDVILYSLFSGLACALLVVLL